jgi:hypothetical protein
VVQDLRRCEALCEQGMPVVVEKSCGGSAAARIGAFYFVQSRSESGIEPLTKEDGGGRSLRLNISISHCNIWESTPLRASPVPRSILPS